jgi:hypothetical protein
MTATVNKKPEMTRNKSIKQNQFENPDPNERDTQL